MQRGRSPRKDPTTGKIILDQRKVKQCTDLFENWVISSGVMLGLRRLLIKLTVNILLEIFKPIVDNFIFIDLYVTEKCVSLRIVNLRELKVPVGAVQEQMFLYVALPSMTSAAQAL